MKFQMHKNSLFAILLRSPWWVSLLVAAGTFGVLRLMIPGQYAIFAALPFITIGVYAGWKQLLAPGSAGLEKTLDTVRAMNREEFSAALEAALRRDGYAVERVALEQADLLLEKGGRRALLACKRWKATRIGIEPLRQLDQARRKQAVEDAIYVAAGEISSTAAAFAGENAIRLIEGRELARLISGR